MVVVTGAGQTVFSFGELLELIDVDGVGAMSVPLPTTEEAAALTGATLRGIAPCVDVHGPCRWRTGLARLYEPPTADLAVSAAHAVLAISRFPDEDIWRNTFEWVSGYLADTLTLTPAKPPRDGHQEYVGQGVTATIAYTRPNPRHDPRELVIEVGVRRDEPPLTAVRRLLGVELQQAIAPPDDGNWRVIPTSFLMHLEGSRHGATMRFRFSALHHDAQVSTASLCEEWCWRWLDLCGAIGPGRHDRSRNAWDLGPLGPASIVRGTGVHRRDVHELHVPAAWLAT